jgi:hypothetical protein
VRRDRQRKRPLHAIAIPWSVIPAGTKARSTLWHGAGISARTLVQASPVRDFAAALTRTRRVHVDAHGRASAERSE